MRSRAKVRQQKHQDKTAQVQRCASSGATPHSAYEVADACMEGLDEQTRLALAGDHVSKLGMATIFSAGQDIAKPLS